MSRTSDISTDPGPDTRRARSAFAVPALAVLSGVLVALANLNGISIGDDGVGYQAIADSLLKGQGLGYFLERPVTVWPPLWPALMAAVAWVTPFGTVGAAILLNCIVAALVVTVGNRLINIVVDDERLVLMGTVVLAVGPATVGLGHVLMTDMAFALVILTWMIVLIGAAKSESVGGLVTAGVLAWVGFGLRYVGLTLIAIGGLWLLLAAGRSLTARVKNAVTYGVVSVIFPLAWMARNYSIDKTFTGERHTSARGLVDNGFDIAATIGRFLVPGVMNDKTKPWAAVGVVVTLAALGVVWKLLRAEAQKDSDISGAADRSVASTFSTAASKLATPVGLVGMWVVLYLAYMLYVRTTTALNQLDLRLLFPAYFTSVVLGLAIAQRLPRLGIEMSTVRAAVGLWAGVNVAAGVVAVVAFGAGHPFFAGDYAGSTFRAVRANPALNALPPGCETYSNLPNALYPRVSPRGWSPQRTALESIDPLDDLRRITERSAKRKVCLVWIDEKPVYGHLWSLSELDKRLSLEQLGRNGPVRVYRVRPAA